MRPRWIKPMAVAGTLLLGAPPWGRGTSAQDLSKPAQTVIDLLRRPATVREEGQQNATCVRSDRPPSISVSVPARSSGSYRTGEFDGCCVYFDAPFPLATGSSPTIVVQAKRASDEFEFVHVKLESEDGVGQELLGISNVSGRNLTLKEGPNQITVMSKKPHPKVKRGVGKFCVMVVGPGRANTLTVSEAIIR